MAQQGFYPDPFTRRMAFDADGSIGFAIPITTGVPVQLTQTQLTNLNDERNTIGYFIDAWNSGGVNTTIGIIFPEQRDLHGYFLKKISGNDHKQIEVSGNTTNGVDGDWVSLGQSVAGSTEVPGFRTEIQQVSATNINGVRVYITTGGLQEENSLSDFHLYGVKSPGQTPHRIDFCDNTGTELNIDFDYGDQPRNSERIWRPSQTWNQASGLYLRNRSATKQANDVSVLFEVVNSSNDMNSHTSLSKDNITYASIVNYTTINPQEIVGPIYVKHDPDISAGLGVKAGRLKLSVGEWL